MASETPAHAEGSNGRLRLAPGLRRKTVWRSLRRARLALSGLVVLVVVTLMGTTAPLLAPQDPGETNILDRLKPPGFVDGSRRVHYLGTDQLGRDILSRLMYGARVSLVVGISAVLIGGTLGLSLGLASGFYGGWIDDLIMRMADIQLAFPSILLYIAVLAVLGPGLVKVIAILGLTGWVAYGRVARGQVLSVREHEFVHAGRAIGASEKRIILRHVLPNIFSAIIVVGSFAVASNIIAEASLSFLGLGVPAAVPTWGSMLAEARDYIRDAWWPVSFPGLAIMLTVLSINALGDWLRDFLDPRLRIGD
jgi:peptide/nickel transport system permease protein